MLLFKSTATRTLLVGQAAYSSLADKSAKLVDKKCSKCSLCSFFSSMQNKRNAKTQVGTVRLLVPAVA